METKNKYNTDWKLLASYMSGNASEAEKVEVQDWLEQSEKNKQIFHEVEKLWNISENADLAEIDIDEAWRQVNSKAKISRRPHFLTLQRTIRYSLRIAALLAIGFFAWYLISNDNYFKTTSADSKLLTLSLNDGSQITLNKGAQLKYPKIFKGNFREVYLEGEAFFNITKNPKKPFIVKIATTEIKVLGTSFNVNANKNGDIEVIVNSGVVSFKTDDAKQKALLHKEDKAVFIKSTGLIEKSINTDPNYLSWKTKKLVFRETKLKDIFDKIEKVYGVRIVAKDTVIYNCRMTATFDNISAEDIIKSIEIAFRYKSFKNGDIFSIEGNDCVKRQ